MPKAVPRGPSTTSARPQSVSECRGTSGDHLVSVPLFLLMTRKTHHISTDETAYVQINKTHDSNDCLKHEVRFFPMRPRPNAYIVKVCVVISCAISFNTPIKIGKTPNNIGLKYSPQTPNENNNTCNQCAMKASTRTVNRQTFLAE